MPADDVNVLDEVHGLRVMVVTRHGATRLEVDLIAQIDGASVTYDVSAVLRVACATTARCDEREALLGRWRDADTTLVGRLLNHPPRFVLRDPARPVDAIAVALPGPLHGPRPRAPQDRRFRLDLGSGG